MCILDFCGLEMCASLSMDELAITMLAMSMICDNGEDTTMAMSMFCDQGEVVVEHDDDG